MAKDRKNTNADELEQLTSTESFIDKFKTPLIIGGGAIVVIIIGIIVYQKFVSQPFEEESRDAYWNAFYEFENDSLQTAVDGTNEFDGMADIADEYAGTSGGDIANYTLGIAAMENGEFESALDYFDACNFDDIVVGSLVLGLKGDCYVEMDDYAAAAEAFEAAAEREENEFTTPMFLKKAGLTYEEMGEMDKAVSAYQKIKDNWEGTEEAANIDKYIARAQN